MAMAEAAAEEGRPQVPALVQAESPGSKRQPGGELKLAAERAMGKSRAKARLCMELERRDVTASRSHSIGKPNLASTVTTEPRANKKQ